MVHQDHANCVMRFLIVVGEQRAISDSPPEFLEIVELGLDGSLAEKVVQELRVDGP